MAYQEPYAGAMAAQNKKKKKQPSMAQAQGAGVQQPQTYGGNKAVNMAPGVGGNEADPLVTAIAEGATGGGLGANNQDGDRAIGTGRPTGSDVFQQNINPQAGQGANTPPPPPPPPPPVQQNMPGSVQGGGSTTTVQQNMPGTVQGGNTQVQQNMPGSVQGTPQVQQNMAGTVQGGMTGPQQTMPQAQQPQPTNMSMAIAQMPQAEKQAAIQDLQRALQNPLHENKDEIRRQLEMFGGQEAPAGSFDFSGQIADLNQALADPRQSQENIAEIQRQLALMGQSGNAQVQQNLRGAVQGTPVQQNIPGSVQGTPQVQQNMPGAVQGAPQVQQNIPGSVQGTPQVQQNMPGAVQGTPQVQQNMAGSVQGTPQVQQNMAGTVQGDDLTTALRDDINRQYTEGMLPATTQAEDINKQYQDAFGDTTTQAEDINRQYTEGMLPATTQREDINKQYEDAFGGTTTQADDINKQYEDAFGGAPVQTTPTDIAGAGADMAAAQNVVTPEAAPMPDTLEDALRQQYMDRIGGTDDPILASQLADQQLRQNEARKAMVEQLGRYGVLRGGGDTAAALTRMGEGDERNRLALEAQAAQRRQQDLRDAQGFDLGQRGMGLQEDRFGQDKLTQELAREVTEAGQTGQFRGGQTMAGQRQEADIFGEVDGRQTLQSDIQRGTLGLGERKTGLAERTGAEDIRRSTAQRGAIAGQEGRAERQLESQLFGEIDGDVTLTGKTTASNLASQDLERRRAEAGLTGTFDYGDQRGTTQTQAAKALASELETAALGRDVSRAGQTGEFEGEDTIEKRLREAQLTGDYLDEEGRFLGRTLAGQQGEMDRVGAILAAADAGIIDNRVAEEELRRVLALSSGGVGAYGDGGGGGGGADLSNEERRNREQQFQDALNRSTNQEEEFGDYNPEGEVIDVGPDGELPEGFTENQDGTFSSMIDGIPQTFIYRKGPQGENVLVNITDPDFRR